MTDSPELLERIVGLEIEEALELSKKEGYSNIRHFPSGSFLTDDFIVNRLNIEFSPNDLKVVSAYLG